MKRRYLVYAVMLTVGSILGVVADRNREFLINGQFIRDHFHFRKSINNKDAILKSERVMIFLAFGQSNSANYGEGEYKCRNEIYNYYKGKLYKAKEPLIGPDGKGVSVWSRIGDMLIDSGLYKKIVIVPIGVGSTSIKSWLEGEPAKKLDETLSYLEKDNIILTHIFWQQGETDNVNGTSKEEYKKKLRTLVEVFRKRQIHAPFYASLSSYAAYDNDNPFGISKSIVDAQNEVVMETKGVFRGPNTDSINLAYYRYEGIHFTRKGLDKLAYEWFKKIKTADE